MYSTLHTFGSTQAPSCLDPLDDTMPDRIIESERLTIADYSSAMRLKHLDWMKLCDCKRLECEGSSSALYMATLTENKGCRVFVKEVRDEDSFARELKVFHHVGSSPSIVQCIGSSRAYRMIVLELADMNLKEYFLTDEYESLDWSALANIARDVVFGLKAIHGANMVHRDIKPENFLIFNKDNKLKVKLSDFGCTQDKGANGNLQDSHYSQILGNILYMSPEVMSRHPFTEKSDIFSLGLVLFEIFSGSDYSPPELSVQDYTLICPLLKNYIKCICEEDARPTIPSKVPPLLKELIQSCWNKDPFKRPSCAQAVDRLNLFLSAEVYAEEIL